MSIAAAPLLLPLAPPTHRCRRNNELVRGRAALLPVISSKDWRDIDWAIAAKVDFIAVSFVRTADVITNLRSYIQTRVATEGLQDAIAGQ